MAMSVPTESMTSFESVGRSLRYARPGITEQEVSYLTLLKVVISTSTEDTAPAVSTRCEPLHLPEY